MNMHLASYIRAAFIDRSIIVPLGEKMRVHHISNQVELHSWFSRQCTSLLMSDKLKRRMGQTRRKSM